MPRQYRRRYKKTKPKQTNYLGNASTAISLASNAIRGVSMLKALVNTEFDYKDTNALSNSPLTGTIVLLNGMTQGDGPSNRTGTSIKMKSYELRNFFTNNSASANTQMRTLLVLDRQPNGVTSNITDIIVSLSVASPRNLDNRKRFKILMDRVYSLCTAGPSNAHDSFYSKDQNLHVQYYNSSNLGTIADIASNALYLIHFSDQAVNLPQIGYYFRMRYVDN